MNKKVKIPLIILGAILFVVCLVVDCTYIYIKYFSGNKVVVSPTFELGLQTLSDGVTKAPFVEIKYHSNTKHNGIELFDVKYNYLLDENKTSFYSQGLQYYGDETSDGGQGNSLIGGDFNKFVTVGDYEKHYKKKSSGTSNYYYHNWFCKYMPQNVFNYQSSDDYVTVPKSTNPISDDTCFKIDISGSTYLMRFKSKYKIASDKNLIENNVKGHYKNYWLWVNFHYYDYYAYMNYTYFNRLLFNAVRDLPSGTNQYVVFEFGDLFDYYVFNEDTSKYELVVKQTYFDEAKQIDENAKVDSTGLLDKIYKEVKSYFVIKVSVTEDGAQRASDSLFNCILGTQNYVLPGLTSDDSVYQDYFVGNSLITLTIDDFEDTFTEMGILLSLTETTRNKYYPYRDKIKFVINIVDTETSAVGIYQPSLDGFNYEIQQFKGGA